MRPCPGIRPTIRASAECIRPHTRHVGAGWKIAKVGNGSSPLVIQHSATGLPDAERPPPLVQSTSSAVSALTIR